jgi:hypothetical protein
VRDAREFTPPPPRGGPLAAVCNLDLQAWSRADRADRFPQAHVVDEGSGRRRAALGVAIGERQRPHRAGRARGALEQRGAKRQDGGAVRGGAFGKRRDRIAALEPRGDFRDDAEQRPVRAALRENGVVARHQAADQRPGACVGFRDDVHRLPRVEDHGVEPGDVVAHQ